MVCVYCFAWVELSLSSQLFTVTLSNEHQSLWVWVSVSLTLLTCTYLYLLHDHCQTVGGWLFKFYSLSGSIIICVTPTLLSWLLNLILIHYIYPCRAKNSILLNLCKLCLTLIELTSLPCSFCKNMLPGDMTPVLQIFCGANGTQINLFDFDSFHNFFLVMKLEKNVVMWLFYIIY